MIVAGVGCRRGAPAPDIETAIRTALTQAGIAANALDAIATAQAKGAEAGIAATVEKPRKKSKPTRASKRRRVEEKRRRSATKQGRRPAREE